MRNNNLGEPDELDKLISKLMDRLTGLLVFHGACGIALSSGDPRAGYIQLQLLEQALELHNTLSKYIELVQAIRRDIEESDS